MKRCSACGKPKRERDFAWKNKSKCVRHSHCRQCQKGKSASWYTGHKAQHILNVKRNTARTRAENRRCLNAYLLQHPCVDCGNPDIRVLDFDHVRGRKRFCISAGITRLSLCWRNIEREIKKCDVRCANCHRIRTCTNLSISSTKRMPPAGTCC